jgi:hypothetical protein
MNYNRIQMMNHIQKILKMIFFIEKLYEKIKPVVLYVMNEDVKNKLDQIEKYLSMKMMIMFGMK